MARESKADELKIDSHKLIYHVDRVNQWLKGKDIYPIYLDVSTTNICNHKCIFCGLDYARKGKCFLEWSVIKRFIKDAAHYGIKSIMYAGEGEPLLHKKMIDIVKHTKNNGIDVSVTTNGVLMNEKFLQNTLKYLTWIRVSIDAGTALTYSKIHRTDKKDFYTVLDNIRNAVSIKKKNKYPVTIGAQSLLLKENAKDMEVLARKLKKIGADYLIVKPYSKHPLSINDAGTEIDYSKMLYLSDRLRKYANSNFKVIFRKDTMNRRSMKKEYNVCYGAPFWAYISAEGEIYACSTFLGIKKYSLGNINKESLYDIWHSSKRKKVMNFIHNKMNAQSCREICRLDSINRYLWELKNPHPHVNFI